VTLPPDEKARRIIATHRHRSLLVEASAGTGKTHSIIDRLVELTVDGDLPIPLRRIAAATFTEKAAGEMKVRLRDRLMAIARDSGNDPRRRSRASQVLLEVEDSQVTTLHALCAILLKERPLEAGLGPGFTQLDPPASEALAHRVWDAWWRNQLDTDRPTPLREALLAGAKLGRPETAGSLAWLALQLYLNRAKLDGAMLPAPAARPLVATARAWLPHLGALADATSRPRDRKVLCLREIIAWIRKLPEDLEGLSASASTAPNLKFLGTPAWEPDQKEELERWREDEYRPFLAVLSMTTHWPLLRDLVTSLREGPESFLGCIEEEKRKRNVLDFDDLLLCARDLLMNSASARAHFRRRFDVLIVDEFQDTDPLQAEIILRLAHEEGGATDWKKLRPSPGRLLLVGDRKQSIYRFRRADVETYANVEALFQGETVRLEASRRSVAPILDWVNRSFEAILESQAGRPYEVAYSPLLPFGTRPVPREKRIVYLDPPPGRETADWKEDEAAAVAAFLRDALSAGRLKVEDSLRPAEPRDIAILVRTNDAVGKMQEALAARGIESVLEGGQDFFKREEPTALLCALRAIDDPEDAIALYAALKSFLFGFSDEELFLARESGAVFDYRRRDQARGELREALDLFGRLRRERLAKPPAETISDLLESTGALESCRARRPGGLQARANLAHSMSLASQIDPGGMNFGAVVRALAELSETPLGEPRAFEENEPAVRVMTVHKAKGLEFPVVVIANFAGRRPDRRSKSLVLSRSGGEWGVSIDFAGEAVRSPEYDEILREDENRQEAEDKRLLYVAATRARDWLIVSRWHKARPGHDRAKPLASTTLRHLTGPEHAARVESLVSIEHPDPDGPTAVPESSQGEPASVADSLKEAFNRIALLRSTAARTKSELLRRAGGEEITSPEDSPGIDRDHRGSELAARMGSAVHVALEAILGQGAKTAGAIREACFSAELGLEHAGEVRAMVERTLASPLIRTALGKRRHVEAPVLFRSPEDGAVVEGKIDLLFEDDRGWVIVDYKTDSVRGGAPQSHFQRYAPQLREYATALRILKVPVLRAVVLWARTGEVFEISI
jgi:ATP-dependent exoDNAse (exonuclease V) beta subunit